MSIHLSQRSVQALKPPDKGSRVWYDDKAPGFGLCVTKAGVKSFVLNYSIAGRERRVKIGRWPEWSADAAREEARRLRVEIDKGNDPLREREIARGEPLMADLATAYMEKHALIY